LDTHVFLWWLAGDSRLGKITMKLIRDPRNEVFVSAVTSSLVPKLQLGNAY